MLHINTSAALAAARASVPGLTFTKLHKAVGIDAGYIAKMEKGQKNISEESQKKFESFFAQSDADKRKAVEGEPATNGAAQTPGTGPGAGVKFEQHMTGGGQQQAPSAAPAKTAAAPDDFTLDAMDDTKLGHLARACVSALRARAYALTLAEDGALKFSRQAEA